jgi:bifunctional DNase/RNase
MREMLVSDIWSIVKVRHGNAVLLKPRGIEAAVPIFIGTLEMQSILLAIDGKNLPRPMTHDLFLNMLHHVNLSVKRVEISELKDDTFHARLIITGGVYTSEKPLVLDSRPSDALAIAVRKKCPFFIYSSVVEQTAIPLDFFLEPAEGDHRHEKNRSLIDQLEQAVAEEEYEQAAEIRDLIKRLESGDDD